jgi:hypothetical protein
MKPLKRAIFNQPSGRPISLRPLALLCGVLLVGIAPGTAMAALPAPAVPAGTPVTGSGIPASEDRKLAAFENLQVDLVATVTVTQSDAFTCTIKADDNLLPLILTELSGKTLRIHAKETFSSAHPVTIAITLPVLSRATLNGAGNLTLMGVTKKSLVAAINGTGTLIANGQTETLTATLNGACNLRAEALETATATVTLTGTGNAKVRATDLLQATVYGTGTVIYTGQPKKIEKSVFGIGAVTAE